LFGKAKHEKCLVGTDKLHSAARLQAPETFRTSAILNEAGSRQSARPERHSAHLTVKLNRPKKGTKAQKGTGLERVERPSLCALLCFLWLDVIPCLGWVAPQSQLRAYLRDRNSTFRRKVLNAVSVDINCECGNVFISRFQRGDWRSRSSSLKPQPNSSTRLNGRRRTSKCPFDFPPLSLRCEQQTTRTFRDARRALARWSSGLKTTLSSRGRRRKGFVRRRR